MNFLCNFFHDWVYYLHNDDNLLTSCRICTRCGKKEIKEVIVKNK